MGAEHKSSALRTRCLPIKLPRRPSVRPLSWVFVYKAGRVLASAAPGQGGGRRKFQLNITVHFPYAFSGFSVCYTICSSQDCSKLYRRLSSLLLKHILLGIRLALSLLQAKGRGSPLVREIRSKLTPLAQSDVRVRLQWVPVYSGNERADELAASTRKLPVADVPLNPEEMRLTVRRHLQPQRPDPRIKRGNKLAAISARNISRQQRAGLLRVGCVWTQGRRQRLSLAATDG